MSKPNAAATEALCYPGHFVSIPSDRGTDRVWMDGFWAHGAKRQPTLILFLHGMHSNFYRSQLKKAFLTRSHARGCDVLTFNNRGAEQRVAHERFEDCLRDIDAVLTFARRQGYRRFVLAGHSTGCQKSVFYQARRQNPAIKGIVLLAPGDDYALARRAAGPRFDEWVQRARDWVAQGRGDDVMRPKGCLGFSARRYLSVADPRRNEAKVFDYDGRLHHFRQVRTPMLLLFGSEEEYACIPVPEMHARLRQTTRSRRFHDVIIPGGDHSFHGVESETADVALEWIASLAPKPRPRR